MKKSLLFVGPVNTASGYGTHARQLLQALYLSGEFVICVEGTRWGETAFLSDESTQWVRDLMALPQHPNPDICIEVTIPNEFRRRAPLTIGVTAGIETDRVSPQWIQACNEQVDLVVVPSEHSRTGFLVEYQGSDGSKLNLNKPIIVVPEGVDTTLYFPADISSDALDNAGVDGKNFVFVGLGLDKPQGRDRKNVTRLIEYFCKAFAGNPNVGLILKTAIVNGSAPDFDATRKRITDIKNSIGCGEFPKLTLLHGRLEESELNAIYNDPRVIAAVSLTHGEGFGLPLIEAAAAGLPVMVTDWSGQLDFLTKDGKKLFIPFAYDLEDIYEESANDWMIKGTKWANVKEADVTTKLQKMVISQLTPLKWAAELSEHVGTKYSLEATGKTFVDLVRKAAEEMQVNNPQDRDQFVKRLRASVSAKGPSVLYTMPVSAGDVFLSTAVVVALRQKHPGYRFFVATSGQYFSIMDGLCDELIDWQPWMQDVTVLEDIFDIVYTPNNAVQLITANWVRRGTGRNLIEEFAVQCGLNPEDVGIPQMRPRTLMEMSDVAQQAAADVLLLSPGDDGPPVILLHSGGQKAARQYAHWPELVKNLRANGETIVQVGAVDDTSVGQVDLDLRGKLQFHEWQWFIQAAIPTAFVGIDSFPMHVCAASQLPVVAIFGSSYANSTGPSLRRTILPNSLRMLETTDRNGCERACYKDVCTVDSSNPCINNIKPATVFSEILSACSVDQVEYKQYRPKLGGYTHIMNPKKFGYPYLESIASMLGFCDEVIVVDGGSTDGSLEELNEHFMPFMKGRLQIISQPWDPDEPGMDGMQKAFGRAMVSQDVEYLWQQDADEVVHEDDFDKIHDMVKRFPSDVDVVHLPVIELWGDDHTVRTDRHSWKWRLSRNNLRVTHGIAIGARLMDPKTGRTYSKEGQSDGCEMIDIVTGEHLPHRGFYNGELERLRVTDPQEYGRQMNAAFKKLPSVFHYSWADLRRKVENFKYFWDGQWSVLYQTPGKVRFGENNTEDSAKRLKEQGGEHGKAETFQLGRPAPTSMKGWVK